MIPASHESADPQSPRTSDEAVRDASPARVLSYGQHPDQHVLLSVHSATGPTAVLVHGGYWRIQHTLHMMDALKDMFYDMGWNVANVEYRRGPEHSWPTPVHDVTAALAAVRAELPDSRITSVGHSVGGQLVLLTSGAVDAVVALAPVTDVARTYREDLGEGAAAEYFQTSPDEAPSLYADASPIALQAVPATPVLLAQGNDDRRVPVEHSLAYIQSRHDSGHPVDAVVLSSLPHMDCVDPHHRVWSVIRSCMGQAEEPDSPERGSEE